MGVNKKFLIILIILLTLSAPVAGKPVKSAIKGKHDYIEAAKNLEIQGKIKDAERLLNAELKKKSTNLKLIQELAELYLNSNQISRAVPLLNKSFKINPKNVRTYSLSAKLFYKNGQYAQTENIARKLLELDPRNSTACILLGYISLMKAKNVDPTNKSQTLELAKKALYDSLNYFNKAIQYDAGSSEAHVGLAEAYMTNNQNLEANDEILKAGELETGDYETLYKIGKFYSNEGDLEKSIKFINKALLINPSDYRAHYLLGTLYEQIGETDKADMNTFAH